MCGDSHRGSCGEFRMYITCVGYVYRFMVACWHSIVVRFWVKLLLCPRS